jgi:hypothetical protein
MTEYQRITLKESGEEFVVDAMEYPYQQAGILYIKFIMYQEGFGLVDSADPIKFLTMQPQDILKREYEWSQEAEDELVGAAEEAAEQEMMTREMYKQTMEEEMARRSALIKPPDEEGGDTQGLFG